MIRSILRRLLKAPASPAAPAVLSDLVGMTTNEERMYYAQAIQKIRSLSGAVVDLGCWMGSTTVSLVHGLEKAGCKEEIVYGFDRFIWDDWMDEYLPVVTCEYAHGESFLPEVRRRVKAHAHRVRLVPADLTTYQWQDGAIKLLLVDAMKTWVLGASITRSFFPSLVPGALVIHQDYKCYDTPWIPLIQYRLRDLFNFTHGVRRGCTVAFELREKLLQDRITAAADFSAVTADEIDAAVSWSAELLGESGKGWMAGCHIMYHLFVRDAAAARRIADSYLNSGIKRQGGFSEALRFLETAEQKGEFPPS
jgi:hypothetical protein